jgi:LacI family transcriptional regulator
MARNPDSNAFQQVVTLAMVAETAGVSPSTVSRILTGHAKVSDDKRAAVEEAIARLNYQPNVLARGLAQGRTLSIGVLTQDIVSPFYGEALRGIEDELVGTGIVPLFVSGHWNVQDEVERMTHLLGRRVDGVIVLTGRLTDQQIREYAQRVPIVVTGRNVKGPNIASMRVDDFKGAYRAVKHLLELGHRRIAHIAGPQDHADSVERLKGYRKALEEAGIPFEQKLVVYADFHEPSGVARHQPAARGEAVLHGGIRVQRPDGLRCTACAFQRNIRVPEDVSLIGFDDLPGSRYVIPPLSTIHQPVYELGQAAARVLLKMIEGGKSKVSLPEPELVARESTRRLR